MTMDYGDVLAQFYPDRQWTVTGENYEDIIFHDDGPVPTQATLTAQYEELKTIQEQAMIDQAEARQAVVNQIGLSEATLVAAGVIPERKEEK